MSLVVWCANDLEPVWYVHWGVLGEGWPIIMGGCKSCPALPIDQPALTDIIKTFCESFIRTDPVIYYFLYNGYCKP